jgi:hypothetical protein
MYLIAFLCEYGCVGPDGVSSDPLVADVQQSQLDRLAGRDGVGQFYIVFGQEHFPAIMVVSRAADLMKELILEFLLSAHKDELLSTGGVLDELDTSLAYLESLLRVTITIS